MPLLLNAWQRLAPAQAELWLLGPVSAKVRSLLPELPGLRVLGEVPGARVPGILQQCDVFVFPSYFEGFGLVILQAMACGLPVITTTATAGPDLIRVPGSGGWVIPTGNEDCLVEAMAHCLANRDDMRVVGKIGRSIAERYSWQVYGQRWMPILDEAASRRPERGGHSEKSRTLPMAGNEKPQALLVHPGTQYSYHLAKELLRHGQLVAFHTGFAIADGDLLGMNFNRLPLWARRRLANRVLDSVPANKLKIHPRRNYRA